MFTSLTDVADKVNEPFIFITIVSVALLALITVLMVVFTFKYRRRRHPKAAEIQGHQLLEIVWTVIPTLIAVGMFWYGWVGYKFMKEPPPEAMQVEVTGRM